MVNQIFRWGRDDRLKDHQKDVSDNDDEVVGKFDILIARKTQAATLTVVCPPTTQSFEHYNINVTLLN